MVDNHAPTAHNITMSTTTTPATAVTPVIAPLPANATRAERSYLMLQLPDSRPAPPADLLLDDDATLAPYMPEAMIKSGDSLKMVFDAQLGVASPRARAFLSAWLRERKYKAAFERAGCRGPEVSQWRAASPAYFACHDAIELWIRSHRHAEAEDTLHALANGELDKTRQVLDKDGVPVTLCDGKIYDSKALALQLAAGDRQRYGQQYGATGGAQVVVQFNMFAPSAPAKVATVTRPASATAEDAEEVDASTGKASKAFNPATDWFTP